jgi:ABC-2 type transport system ATP-binding protein
MSTPYLDEAERCSRVALIHEGRLLAADEPARLRTAGGERIVEIATSGGLRLADTVAHLSGVAAAQVFGERLHVTLDDMSAEGLQRFAAALGATPLAGAPLRVIPPSLEDVFISRLSAQEKSRA